MSAVTVRLAAVCAGGNHLTFSVTGDATLQKIIDRDGLSKPIEEQDIDSFLRVITKLARMGRTNAQALTLLQSGVTVTV